MKNGLKRFLFGHWAALGLLASGCLGLVLFYGLRGNAAAMVWWVREVSMPVKRGLGAVADLFPFSVCEVGATLLILAALCQLGRCVWLLVKRRENHFAGYIVHLAALLVCGWAGVCGLWGTQYYAPGFAAQAGMTAPAVSMEQLTAVTEYFGQQVNATAGTVPRDANGVFAVPYKEVLRTGGGLYENLAECYPFIDGPERTPKPGIYSKLMSAWGFTGYLCPLVGESTLNVDCPTMFLPVTVAHEFAHQRGVAAEQEANFVGVLAAVQSTEASYVYSGWLFGYLHLSNALYSVDPSLARELYARLCPEALADMAANNAYWNRWEGPVKETGSKVYTAFLENYGQELGMQSYGACVDLLVEHYLPKTTAGG